MSDRSDVRSVWRLGALIIAAAIGAILLAVVVAVFWSEPNDSLAYWIAGSRLISGVPIYMTGESAFAPFAYHYPPPFAQALAPLTLVLPALAYVIAFRALELLALWDIAGRRLLPTLALVAFLPVAVELRFENVHLLMALGIVYGLRRWPWLFAVGAIIKVSPGLGIVYLIAQRRWRDAAFASLLFICIVAVSVILDLQLWRDFLSTVFERAGVTGNSLVPVPYVVRAVTGLGLAFAGGLRGRQTGELLLVAGIAIANPNLALNGLAVLAAAVPIWFAGPAGIGAERQDSRRP